MLNLQQSIPLLLLAYLLAVISPKSLTVIAVGGKCVIPQKRIRIPDV